MLDTDRNENRQMMVESTGLFKSIACLFINTETVTARSHAVFSCLVLLLPEVRSHWKPNSKIPCD